MVKPLVPGTKFTINDQIAIPITHLPTFRTELAVQSGVEKNLLFRTWGGLGDQICSEPTLRYALKKFRPKCSISLASEKPSLFEHLEFDRVFDLNDSHPNYSNYLTFETITPPNDSNLVWQFFSHMLTNCVDFPSMCALRMQLPIEDREIFLTPESSKIETSDLSKKVFVHPGRHWASKTFPKLWWDRVIYEIKSKGFLPVIIGADTDDNRGTVDVDTDGCLDLRNKISIMDMVYFLQRAKVLITNDSAPMHMAASRDPNNSETGHCWVGYVATCKHPDMITHWRHGKWQYREQNLGRGGIWDIIDCCPNATQEVSAEFVPPEILESWLPEPEFVGQWVLEKMDAL